MKAPSFILVSILFLGTSNVYAAKNGKSESRSNPQQIIHLGTLNPLEIQANNFFAEGEKMLSKRSYNDALIYFGTAAQEYGNAKMNSKYADCLMRMSDIHRVLKNYKVASDIILNKALYAYSKMGSKIGEMNAYRQLGKIYYDSGKYTESLWFFTQHGIIAKNTANRLAYIESVLDIAQLKIKKREFKMATADINRAELLAKTANTSKFVAQISEVRRIIKERS